MMLGAVQGTRTAATSRLQALAWETASCVPVSQNCENSVFVDRSAPYTPPRCSVRFGRQDQQKIDRTVSRP